MRQRGRKSVEQLLINVSGEPLRLETPAGLNAKEREMFAELVNSTNPDHFRPSDIPMLIAFVQASLLSRKLARSGTISDWEKATRCLSSLATRLRLTRMRGRMRRPSGGVKPSEFAEAVDDAPSTRKGRKTVVRSSEPVSQAERDKAGGLGRRYRYLLAMLPNSVDDFDTDDADAFNARLADIEMIRPDGRALTMLRWQFSMQHHERSAVVAWRIEPGAPL